MLNYLLALREQLGIPHTLDEIGIDDSRAAEIGNMAFHDPCAAGNAKPISAPELERLFRAAHSGNMGFVTTD
jgi:alcohol dehydrogenase class IV